MKKTKKLEIKKVTLQNLDEPTLSVIAGGGTGGGITCYVTCLCSVVVCPHTEKTCVDS
ncbi:MAG: TIGR04149 family rSAM-modified RiPP [Candidatus Sulfotelmatobacter sp.]